MGSLRLNGVRCDTARPRAQRRQSAERRERGRTKLGQLQRLCHGRRMSLAAFRREGLTDSFALPSLVARASQRHATGQCRFTPTEWRDELRDAARENELLWVEVAPPSPSRLGALGRTIRDAVDAALDRRGAPGPGLPPHCDDIEALNDRLYRARLVELRGIALWLPTLEGIAGSELALETADSDALRCYLQATRERPLWVYLDDANRRLGVYTAPVPLNALVVQASTFIDLDHSPLPPLLEAVGESPEPPPASEPRPVDAGESSGAQEPFELEPARVTEPLACAQPLSEPEPAPSDIAPQEDLDGLESDVATPSRVAARRGEPGRAPLPVDLEAFGEGDPKNDAQEERGSGQVPDDDDPEISAALIAEISLSDATPEPPAGSHDEPVPVPNEAAAPSVSTATPAAPHPREDAFSVVAKARWETWVAELERVHGPKPLSVVERMFVSAYIPLQQALLRGIGDARADAALSAWSKSFAQSYSEAFNAFRVRGKRPSMVLDAPDLALRIGKLHGARAVELIMVTSMRFDLGLAVFDELQGRLKGHGALVEKTLLWAALPTTTPVQLELLAKGEAGLKEPLAGGEFDVTATRGSNAHGLRRIKALHRELYRLDSIQAHFSEPGGPLVERLDEAVTLTAALLAEHLNALPPRTLALIFGDHGFVVDPLRTGTSSARSGGATPEETLVPAFAWLRGAGR